MRKLPAIIFILGAFVLCAFLTPFAHRSIFHSEEAIFYSNIFHPGEMVVGRFLMFFAVWVGICFAFHLIITQASKKQN